MTISYITERDLTTYFGDYGYVNVTIVIGDYLYIGGGGYNEEWDDIPIMDIWDISTPENPVHERTITWGSSFTIYDFALKDDRLYIAAPDFYGNAGIYSYDVSDPSNPSYVDMIAGSGSPNYLYYVSHICIDGNYLYASGTAESPNYLVILDISDPDNIALENAVFVRNTSPVTGVSLDYFIARDGIGYGHIDGWRMGYPLLITYDLTDPQNPDYLWTSTGEPDGGNNGVHGVLLSGDTMLIPHWWTGGHYYSYFRTWDISDPENVLELDTFPADWRGNNAAGVYFLGGIFNHLADYIIGSDDERLSVYDISTPSAISFVESSYDLDFGDYQYGLSIKGNVGYYIDEYNSPYLKVISLSDYISIGIQVGDNVLLIPNYGDIYDRAAIKGGAISTGENVQLYPLKGGTKVAIKEEWSAGDKIIF